MRGKKLERGLHIARIGKMGKKLRRARKSIAHERNKERKKISFLLDHLRGQGLALVRRWLLEKKEASFNVYS